MTVIVNIMLGILLGLIITLLLSIFDKLRVYIKNKEKPVKQVKVPNIKRFSNSLAMQGICFYGYAFGTDCDEKKECNRCEMWEACSEAQENM